ncbi:MAG: FMN-binding protein [Erysipelotrichaceae bacterium]|nr:FMN-binding protein [Erysipelotrichaceae bacterium]
MVVKKMIISVLFLAFVSAVAGAAITFFNDMTAPTIAINAEREEQATLRKMFPDGEFAEIGGYTECEEVLAVYEVKGQGYIVKGTAVGYNSSTPIIVLVGFDQNGVTTGMLPLQQQETSGYGSRCFETDFSVPAYTGKSSTEEVDMLSGATRTSDALRRIMEASFRVMEEVK